MSADGRPLALITGGSEGIGFELAKCLARDGYDLVLVARNPDKLQSALEALRSTGVSLSVLPLDLSASGAAERLLMEMKARGRPVDVLVNNAGVGLYGPFASSPLERNVEMMRLNMEALVGLTRLFVEEMVSRGRGRILNVGSTAGFQPGPLMAVYYASKAFVLSFSEALANELRGTGVQVSVLCPGPTRTSFQARAGVGALFRRNEMSAERVAAIAYREFKRGAVTIVPGLVNRLLGLIVRLAPRAAVPPVVRWLQQKRARA